MDWRPNRTWRLGDLGSKHALLLAGVGWGNMPEPMVHDDLASGRLKRLDLSEWNARRLARRLQEELNPDAWQHLSAVAMRRGGTVAQLLDQGLSEGQ